MYLIRWVLRNHLGLRRYRRLVRALKRSDEKNEVECKEAYEDLHGFCGEMHPLEAVGRYKNLGEVLMDSEEVALTYTSSIYMYDVAMIIILCLKLDTMLLFLGGMGLTVCLLVRTFLYFFSKCDGRDAKIVEMYREALTSAIANYKKLYDEKKEQAEQTEEKE